MAATCVLSGFLPLMSVLVLARWRLPRGFACPHDADVPAAAVIAVFRAVVEPLSSSMGAGGDADGNCVSVRDCRRPRGDGMVSQRVIWLHFHCFVTVSCDCA